MPFDKRIGGYFLSSGPFLAEITNHLDPNYMGRLEVSLIKGIPTSVQTQSNTFIVNYLSPFYGVTSVRFEGNNSADFNDVQKSYGMWMVPPDIGTRVLVIFIDGDPNQGYWIGCVMDKFQNHMVPGIAASEYVALTAEQKQKYDTTKLPVAEFNKKVRFTNAKTSNTNPDTISKPVHPFADRLLAQGLLLDDIRGITSSSARRPGDLPSSVFGISTPGPVDESLNAKRGTIGYAGDLKAPVSRLGGTTFVMDDGDRNGNNELVRIRTRTGHQILLHNTKDLVYIANAKGSAWIELTSSGKIDVYAEDSISMHTAGDFNLRANRDFNLEAGRNFNISSTEGDCNINVRKKLNVISDQFLLGTSHNIDLTAGGALIVSTTGDLSATSKNNINLAAAGESRYSSTGKFSLYSNNITAIRGATDLSLSGGSSVTIKAPILNLNGPAATIPTATDTPVPEAPVPLNLYSVPQTDSNAGWNNGNRYKTSNLDTIMQRVPMHEPWEQHESINPTYFGLDRTDTSILPSTTAENGAIIPGAPSANIPYPSKNGPGGDRGKLRYQLFPWTTDQLFLNKVKEVAATLKFDAIDLLAIMNLETNRTFDPAITNSIGATGLIQFIPSTARELGTTTDALRQLNRVEQMDWVYKYFKKWGWPSASCPNPSLVNLYLTVLLPSLRFSSADTKIADATNPYTKDYYYKNLGFDPQRLGYFTPAMVEVTVISHKREVLQCLSNNGVGLDLIVPTK